MAKKTVMQFKDELVIPEKRLYWANLLLENPLFKSVLEEIRKEIFEQWRGTPLEAQEAREDCYRLLRITELFEAKVKVILANALYEQEINKTKEAHNG